MIFLDANLFLRYLGPDDDSSQSGMKETARLLILSLDLGKIEGTTSEVVLHEVCFILTSRKHYGLSAHQAINAVEPLLRMRALRFPSGDREIYLRAMEIWSLNPKLEFSDSVIAARCEANGWELATFDEQLGSLPNVTRWNPEPAA